MLCLLCYLSIFGNAIIAQDCRDILKRAEELYGKGHLDEVRTILSEECIKILSEKREKEEAYYMLALSNLYMKSIDSAKTAVMTLLRANPEYVCKRKSPIVFQKFYETFRTTPLMILGIKAGLNSSQIHAVKTYSLDQASTSQQATYKNILGFQFNGMLSLPITKRIDIMSEFGFKYFVYEFQATQFEYSRLRFREKQSFLELPIMVKFNFGDNYTFKEEKKILETINPYILAGVSGTLLLGSSASVFRKDETQTQTEAGFNGNTQVSMGSMRQKIGYYFTAGAGISYKQGRGVWSIEARYNYGFADAIKSKTRYSNQTLLFGYGYVDSDIKFRNLAVSVGYAYPIYRPKQKRNFYIEDIPTNETPQK